MMQGARRLTDIANETGTDKGTVHNGAHAYTLVYEPLLEGLRHRPINLMEIGLEIGGPERGAPSTRSVTDMPSIRMWREYFPQASIYGVDISDFARFETEWFRFRQADCGDAGRLQAVAAEFRSEGIAFDIIIDDASHASYHQQLTLLNFFGLLKPGGLYIIEDMSWVPKSYEASLPSVPRTREVLAQILASGSVSDGGAIPASDWEKILFDVGTILTFDDLYLTDLSRCYSARHGRVAASDASAFRRLYKGGRSIARLLAGERVAPQVSYAKLAVLQRVPMDTRGAGMN